MDIILFLFLYLAKHSFKSSYNSCISWSCSTISHSQISLFFIFLFVDSFLFFPLFFLSGWFFVLFVSIKKQSFFCMQLYKKRVFFLPVTIEFFWSLYALFFLYFTCYIFFLWTRQLRRATSPVWYIYIYHTGKQRRR